MSDLRKILLTDETILFHTKKNWVIFTTPVIWTLFTLFILSQKQHFISNISGLPLINSLSTLAWLPGIIAAFTWINQWLTYITSDFLVTNQRVIMREGFFFRHATETRLSTVAEIKIDQNLVGQIFNFGSITVRNFGGGADIFYTINSPYEFQRQVAERSQKPAL